MNNSDLIAQIIRQFIAEVREKKHIVNEVIRDDVFAILKAECIVLFYVLEDSGVEGCHMIKPVNEEMKQFVFINTTKAVQEQTWTAAHELGHVWQVDSYIKEKTGLTWKDIKVTAANAMRTKQHQLNQLKELYVS